MPIDVGVVWVDFLAQVEAVPICLKPWLYQKRYLDDYRCGRFQVEPFMHFHMAVTDHAFLARTYRSVKRAICRRGGRAQCHPCGEKCRGRFNASLEGYTAGIGHRHSSLMFPRRSLRLSVWN